MNFYPSLSNYEGLTFKAQLSSILCVAWKVLNEPKTHIIQAWDYPTYKKNKNDDTGLLKDLSEVLANCDAIITHNGRRFDAKFIQTRLLLHGMQPMNRIPHIDTCVLAKSNLIMFNNRLGNLGQYFVKDKKIDNGGWDLWTRIQFENNDKDLHLMAKYCKQDVVLLEKVFKILRPFAANIPNYNLWLEGKTQSCPSCGSSRLKNNGYRATKTSTYKRLLCRDCGSSCRTNADGSLPRSL